MSQNPQKFFLTTPIYYVNARPHIGHAYTTIVADVIARRSRAQQIDTWFLTGTDEHGQKIERSAAAAGIPPQEFTDKVSATFREPWRRMGITNDDFIRTTEPRHKQGVQKLFTELYKRDFIYLSSYTGSYCVSDEAFVELPSGTPCPDCGRPLETVTEENFFFRLSQFQEQIIDLIVGENGATDGELEITPFSLKNEILSFLSGDYSHFFREYFDKNPEAAERNDTAAAQNWCIENGHIKTSVHGFHYVPGALRDLSISRSTLTWGVPVPEPAASAAKDSHVIYVWLDALANYMTAVGYGSDKPEDIAKFERYWPADLHLIGKEIARFHCVYWPAFLLAANLQLPKKIAANGWLLFHDSKMSKSKGNVVRIETILDGFGTLCPANVLSSRSEAEGSASALGSRSGLQPAESDPNETGALAPAPPTKAQQDLFASDVLRYFLLREIPFGQDGNFSLEAMVTRYNADLANGYGNLVSRTLSMIYQYFSFGNVEGRPSGTARIPPLESEITTLPVNDNLRMVVAKTVKEYDSVFGENDFSKALEQVWNLVTATDVMITATAPWKLAKVGTTESLTLLRQILYTAAESIRIITALLYPILPYATASVWRQLGLGDIETAAHNGQLKDLQWGGLKPGTRLGTLAPIFPRADKGLTAIMMQMEQDQNTPISHANAAHDAAENTRSEFPEMSLASATVPHTPPEPGAPGLAPETWVPADASPQIGIDDFAKVELRVAKVLVAERIPKADKLLRLEVDLGFEKRQILSGIAEWYTPEELIGRRIVVITNLAPRKMRGLESHGMLLAASTEGGKPHLATFADSEDLPLGSRLK